MQITKKEITDKLIIAPGTKKCFIFDLDGTIIFEDKPLCTKYENLLRTIHEANHEIMFASGRPLREFRGLMPEWTHDFSMALFGGGLSLKNSQIIRQNIVPMQNSLDLIELCFKHNAPFILDDHSHYYHPDKYHMVYEFLGNSPWNKCRLKKIDEILTNGIYKVFILEDVYMEHFSEYVKTTDLALHHHTRFNSFDILLSIIPSKAI